MSAGSLIAWPLLALVLVLGLVWAFTAPPPPSPSDYCRPAWHPELYCTPGEWQHAFAGLPGNPPPPSFAAGRSEK